MPTKEKSYQLTTELFRSLLDEGSQHRLHSSVHDVFVRIDLERGEVFLLGEDEEVICSCTIFSWIQPEAQTPTEEMRSTLLSVVAHLEREGFWEHALFEHPFSVVLVDSMFSPIETLLYLDDDTIQVSRPLLEGLTEDLDDFVKNLLGELK